MENAAMFKTPYQNKVSLHLTGICGVRAKCLAGQKGCNGEQEKHDFSHLCSSARNGK